MANHITQLRRQAGFRHVEEAAKALDISKSMLYQVEGFHKKPSVGVGIKMAKEFNCSLEEIFLPFDSTDSDN